MPLQDLTPQLRTRLRRVEKVVSLFVALATLFLLVGFGYYLYHTAERKGWFVEKCPYFTLTQSAEGLNVGDPVQLIGLNVGEITQIVPEEPGKYYHFFVAFNVRKPYYGYIWSDSKAKVASSGLLNQRGIEITAGVTGTPTAYETEGRLTDVLHHGERTPLSQAPKGVFVHPDEQASLSDRAEKLVGQVEQALPSILGITNRLNTVLDNTAQLTSNANQVIVGAQPVVTNLAEITGHLRDPKGSLGEWIIPTNLQTQLSATVGAVNTNLLTLNQTLLHVASITSNLNAQVQNNDLILSEISRLVVETDDLVQGLKRHWLLKSAFPQTSTNAPQTLSEPDTQ